MYKLKVLITACILLFCTYDIRSQISVTPSVGCLPGITNANFSYTGSSPASNIVWNFGDGSPNSGLTSPQHSYLGLGTYIVTFTALINGNQQTFTTSVTVYPLPAGNFTYALPQSGCLPMSVNFTGTSPGTNVAYLWDFGDNVLGNGASALHVYNSKGIFTPVLTIQNTVTGCFLNVNGPPVSVSAPPSLVISSNPGLTSCSFPFTTAFSASNSVSGSPVNPPGLNFSWNFGNGQSSGQVTPGNTTYGQGKFTVSLTATDNNTLPCSATTTVEVIVITPTVDAITPKVVCIASQDYTNQTWPNQTMTVSSSQSVTTWQMGDGITKIIPSPNYAPPKSLLPNTWYKDTVHYYTTPGPKILTITATAGTCVATINRTIFVQEITPGFTVVPKSFVCTPNLVVTYSNTSSVNYPSNLSYTWTGTHWNQTPASAYTSTATHPTFTFVQGSKNPYTIYNVYSPTVTILAISDTPNCKAVLTQTMDRIRRPTAWFSISAGEGCAPLSVIFEDQSVTDPILFPITGYTWHNGATGSNSLVVTGTGSTIPNFIYTYSATGTYSPYLTIQTQGGCNHTSFTHTINVSSPPAINYTLPVSPVCAGAPLQLTLSPGSGETVQHWNVQSDGGYFSGCVNDAMPVWKFTHPGVHGFTISAYQFGCKTTVTTVPDFTVTGPVAKGRVYTNCVNPKTVSFVYRLEDASSATLDYGDSQNSLINGAANGVVTGTLIHSYAASGDYVAVLRGFNNGSGCPPFADTLRISVRDISVDFTMTPVICKGTSQTVSVSATDILTGCGRAYTWFYDDLPTEQTTNTLYISYSTFTALGIHTLTLKVRDVNGCTETLTKNFRVSNPTPAFSFNKNPICLSDYPLQITNNTMQLPDAVPNYTWVFGDGTPGSTLIASNNPGSSPSYTYHIGAAQSKDFSVLLIAQNSIGCIDSLRKTITVNDPIANFAFIPDLCLGQITNFQILGAPSHTLYNFKFGDASVVNTTLTNLVHNYLLPGIYTPTLTVTDNGGCIKSYSQSFEVQLYPVADFSMSSVPEKTFAVPGQFCLPFTASVTSTSYSPSTLNYYWNMGNGGPGTSGTSYTAGGTYTITGVYTITLTVNTTAGCANTKTKTIYIHDPKANFELVPPEKNRFCMGEPITVRVKDRTGVDHWQWDFGDNTNQPVIYSSIMMTYSHIPIYFPSVTNGSITILLTAYSSGSPAACKDIQVENVQIIRVLSDFKRNNEINRSDTAHCLGTEDKFNNLTQSNSSFSTSLKYEWKYGDGTTSFDHSPVHIYTLPGIYTVELEAIEPAIGCKSNTRKTITVFPLPSASFSLNNLTCPDSVFTISGNATPGISGLVTGTLIPQPGAITFTPSNSFTVSTSINKTTNFTLNVTDNNGCKSPPFADSIIVQKPAAERHWDTTIVVGQTVQLNAFAGNGFSYTWTPVTTSLSCVDCMFPVSGSTVSITYSVQIADHPLGCFERTNTFHIDVLPKTTVDVPSAFTPNGDGTNDIVYADGWGIKKLNYFRIYNRWGQIIFETNNIHEGWDGSYLGVVQNMETYVYQVSVESYTNETITKSGTIKLIR